MSEFRKNLKNTEEFKKHDVKKFVFQLYDENIDFLELMPSGQKNNLINRLIYNYRAEDAQEKKRINFRNLCKKIAITVALVLIGLPLLVFLVNFSFEVTLNSYSEMEKNFEKLFD